MIRNTCQARTNDVTKNNYHGQWTWNILAKKKWFAAKNTIVLTVSRLLEVNISISKRASGNHIATDAYREYGPSRWKLLEKHRLGDITVQIADVEWRHRIIRSPWVHIRSIPSSCSCLSWKNSLVFGLYRSFNMACALPTTLLFVTQWLLFFSTLYLRFAVFSYGFSIFLFVFL